MNFLNKNVLLVGGSISGKTRYFESPMLASEEASFLVTGPDAGFLEETHAEGLRDRGYDVKVLEFDGKERFNPLAYVKEDLDCLRIAQLLCEGSNSHTFSDTFWYTARQTATAAFLRLCVKEGKSIASALPGISVDVLKHALMEAADIPGFSGAKELAGREKELGVIIAGINILLEPFVTDNGIYGDNDTLELDTLSARKMAVFIDVGRKDPEYVVTGHLVADIVSQNIPGQHPVRVFFTGAPIPDGFLLKMLASRETGVWYCTSLQRKEQFSSDEMDWQHLVSACEATLFLGDSDVSTTEFFAGPEAKHKCFPEPGYAVYFENGKCSGNVPIMEKKRR